ncbi:hypothetical protein EJ06DRAFT_541891 [Trichodelitschia bisporula]|uniref:CipC-like antibiotic response protein n=1 Tax=Trichodelitschia bisporula TaxID=703511 RepID=A0A6G1I4E0_9PEZI|nr:hypothetical protein EJ06DRAFT_541891 [Trichodelitschia bisporula]
MPFGWGESQDAYQQCNSDNQPEYGSEEHKSKFSHELLAGGAAFGAFKMFEDAQRKEGKPVSHQFAKEALAGLAAAEVDKIAETKGADWVDRERAKHEAKKSSERMYDEHYGDDDQYDPRKAPPRQLQQEFGNQW